MATQALRRVMVFLRPKREHWQEGVYVLVGEGGRVCRLGEGWECPLSLDEGTNYDYTIGAYILTKAKTL